MHEITRPTKLYGDAGIYLARLIECKDPSVERHEVEQILQYAMMAIKEADEILDALPSNEKRNQVATTLVDQLFSETEVSIDQMSFPQIFLKYYVASFPPEKSKKVRMKAIQLFQTTELVKNAQSVTSFTKSTLTEAVSTIDFLLSIIEDDIDKNEFENIKKWLTTVAQAANIFDSLIDIEEDREKGQIAHHNRLSLAVVLATTFALKSLAALPQMPRGVIAKVTKHVFRDFKRM